MSCLRLKFKSPFKLVTSNFVASFVYTFIVAQISKLSKKYCAQFS